MSKYDKYSCTASSYPYPQEDKNDQKVTPPSKNSESLSNQKISGSGWYSSKSFQTPNFGSGFNFSLVDLNIFNVGFDCGPNTFTNLFNTKTEINTSSEQMDSVYPCTDSRNKNSMNGNSNVISRRVDEKNYLADIKQFSTEYVEDSNFFNSNILQSPSCDKSVGVSEKLAEWIRCKLSQTKSLPGHKGE